MGLGVRELFDNNIKVHFAGSDGGEIFYAALLAAQTKYRLFSCYKYILKCRPDDDFRQHHHEPDLGHGDLCGHQFRLRSGLGAYP